MRDPVRPLAVVLATVLVGGVAVVARRSPGAQPAARPAAAPGSGPQRVVPTARPVRPTTPPPLRPVSCAPDRPARRGVAVRGRVVDAWDRPLACSRVVLTAHVGFGDYFTGIMAALSLGLVCRNQGACDFGGATVARTGRDGRFTAYVDSDKVDHTLAVTTPDGSMAALHGVEVTRPGPVELPEIRVWSLAPRAVRRGNDVTVRFAEPPASWRAEGTQAYVLENGHEITAALPFTVTNTLVLLEQAHDWVRFDLRRVEDRPATLYVQTWAGGALQVAAVRVPAGPRALSRGARCSWTRGPCLLTDGVLTDPARGSPPVARGPSPGIDLGRVRQVSYLVVHGCVQSSEYEATPPTVRHVEVSGDGRTWRPVTLGTHRVGLYTLDCAGPVDEHARYVRLRGDARLLREIAVF